MKLRYRIITPDGTHSIWYDDAGGDDMDKAAKRLLERFDNGATGPAKSVVVTEADGVKVEWRRQK